MAKEKKTKAKAKPKKEKKKATKAKPKKQVKAKKTVKTKRTVARFSEKQPETVKEKEVLKPVVADIKQTVTTEKKEEKPEIQEKELGEVTNYFEHVQAAAIKLAAPLSAGDTIHVRGGEVDFEQKVTSMQINRVPVANAKVGDEVGIRMNQHVRKGYKIYLK